MICLIDGCNKTRKRSRDWCSMHCERIRIHGNPDTVFRAWHAPEIDVCIRSDCERTHHARGLCLRHYHKEYTTSNRIKQLAKSGWDLDRWAIHNYAQGGLCSICCESNYMRGKDMRLVSDHDHETGKPRGLLCSRCNLGLGYIEDNLESIVRYLCYTFS